MRASVLSFSLILVMSLLAAPAAHAQIVLTEGDWSLSNQGWINLTGAGGIASANDGIGVQGHVFTDAALRETLRYKLGSTTNLGARVVPAVDSDGGFRIDQATGLVEGSWGRFELGRRQGLPDVLEGYAPNPYTYTSAEFGPASGTSLDPDGGLPTRFLDDALAGQINALSYLGNTPALAGDRAVKGLYVSPRLDGFIFGVAYTPDANSAPVGRGRDFRHLVQSGISYELYDGQNVYRIGTSYSFAQGDARVADLHSVSGGASATIGDWLQPGSTTIVGVNVSSDADTGLVRGGNHATAIGVTTSANYEIGPWIAGGYYQYATAEGDVATPGRDRLHVFELGGSYRFSTKWRAYNAFYLYDFTDEGTGASAASTQGALFLMGLRATL